MSQSTTTIRNSDLQFFLDDQIRRYFGIPNLTAVRPQAVNAGIEHMKVDLALAKDRRERFALWALLQSLGSVLIWMHI